MNEIALELDGKKFHVQIFEQEFAQVPRVDGEILHIPTGGYANITYDLPLELQRAGALSKLFRLAKAHGFLEYPFGSGFETQTARVNMFCAPWRCISKSGDKLQPFYDSLEYRPVPPKPKPMQSLRYS